MMNLNITETDLSVEPGMDAMETGAFIKRKDGSSFEVKARLDFPEGEALGMLKFLSQLGSEETIFEQIKAMALRGDESCQKYMIELYEKNSGEKVSSFDELLEFPDEDQQEG